jgi:hypothetical protein
MVGGTTRNVNGSCWHSQLQTCYSAHSFYVYSPVEVSSHRVLDGCVCVYILSCCCVFRTPCIILVLSLPLVPYSHSQTLEFGASLVMLPWFLPEALAVPRSFVSPLVQHHDTSSVSSSSIPVHPLKHQGSTCQMSKHQHACRHVPPVVACSP